MKGEKKRQNPWGEEEKEHRILRLTGIALRTRISSASLCGVLDELEKRVRERTLSINPHLTLFFSQPLIAHSFGVICPWCFVCTSFWSSVSFFFSSLSSLSSLSVSAHTDKHGFSAGHWCKYLKPHYALRKLRRCPAFFTECNKVEFG